VAAIHPSSINSKVNAGEWKSCYVAFHECVRTTKVYAYTSSLRPPRLVA
jgi:ATP-dependent RNA helicase DHX57